MNETALTQPRRVLPRWRLFTPTVKLGELSFVGNSIKEPVSFDNDSELVSRWKSRGEISVGIEVLSKSMLESDANTANETALLLGRHAHFKFIPPRLKELIWATIITDGVPLSQTDLNAFYRPEDRNISDLRKSLKLFPRNPIAWCELALLYARQGNKDKASNFMKIAASLAPNDRFILRSAARCFAHLNDPEIGFSILNATQRTKSDPWLLSAQIALAHTLKKPQKLFKNAISVAESNQHSPWDVSELNAALGSIMKNDGAYKKANKFFRASLRSPTENALCQVMYDQRSSEFTDLTKSVHPQRNFEYEARSHYLAQEIDKASASARMWLNDEPFSSRAALFGYFAYAVGLEDHQQALSILKDGLRANPHDGKILNNIALSLARLGSTTEATAMIAKAHTHIDPSPENLIMLEATEGLILFRKGELEAGRLKYEKAISWARKQGHTGQEAMAKIFLAREEHDARTTISDIAFERAQKAAEKLPDHIDLSLALGGLRKARQSSASPIEDRQKTEA